MQEPFPLSTQVGSGPGLAALGRKPAECWGPKHIPTETESPHLLANRCTMVGLRSRTSSSVRRQQLGPAGRIWAARVLSKAVLCSADRPNPDPHQGPAIAWALRGPESALESFHAYY